MRVELNGFAKGDFVELHPACDAWMRGDKFGEVVGHSTAKGRIMVRVKLTTSGRIGRFHPDNLTLLERAKA